MCAVFSYEGELMECGAERRVRRRFILQIKTVAWKFWSRWERFGMRQVRLSSGINVEELGEGHVQKKDQTYVNAVNEVGRPGNTWVRCSSIAAVVRKHGWKHKPSELEINACLWKRWDISISESVYVFLSVLFRACCHPVVSTFFYLFSSEFTCLCVVHVLRLYLRAGLAWGRWEGIIYFGLWTWQAWDQCMCFCAKYNTKLLLPFRMAGNFTIVFPGVLPVPILYLQT